MVSSSMTETAKRMHYIAVCSGIQCVISIYQHHLLHVIVFEIQMESVNTTHGARKD